MGRSQRPRPAHLAAKLLQIRRSLKLTQREMLEHLNYNHSVLAIGHISDFELDKREPPLSLLLRYAQVADISLEALVDDESALPESMTAALNKTVDRIVTALKDFDAHESLLHHDQLEIRLPSGFFRYAKVSSAPDKQWDPVDICLTYYHRKLRFSIQVVERSYTPRFTIIEHRRHRNECMTEYRVAENVKLSLRDARQLLLFLQDYFRCFYFSLNTKLSK